MSCSRPHGDPVAGPHGAETTVASALIGQARRCAASAGIARDPDSISRRRTVVMDAGVAPRALHRPRASPGASPRRGAAARPVALGFLPGIATRRQNRTRPGTSAFVVDLPGGPLRAAAVRRHARAVRAVAARAPG
jgi:hypothetical protein